MRLTVYFDGRFWIGVLEEQEWGGPPVRHVFGAEPGDKEILLFVRGLMPSSELPSDDLPDCPPAAVPRAPKNPKRLIREAARAMKKTGGSTKAREALSLMREESKKKAGRRNKLKEKTEKERKREIAKIKARKRHQGH
jgi:hypothetical protein